jgi:outer membrane receptor protein involved in Fe transport
VGIGSDRWEFSAGVENLFDEEHYTDATLFPNFNPLVPQDAIIIGTLGQPRLLTAAFKVMF